MKLENTEAYEEYEKLEKKLKISRAHKHWRGRKKIEQEKET